MDDFPGLLARDFGYRPQGKSAPMAPPRSTSSGTNNNFTSSLNFGLGSSAPDHARSSSSSFRGNSNNKSNSILEDHDRDGLLFNDVFGGPPKYSSSSSPPRDTRGGGGGSGSAPASAFDYDSVFKDQNSKSSSMPVFDKPVYDDDIFDGLPGLKSSTTSTAKYDDVFGTISGSPPKHRTQNSSPFDDLLGNLGKTEGESKSERVRMKKDAPVFDDLIPGFGRSSSPATNRSTSDSSRSQKPSSNSTKTASNVMEDPFAAVFESTSTPAVSSSGLFTDPLEEISKFSSSGNTRLDGSSVSGGAFDDIDPLDSLGKSIPPFSSEINKRGKDRSPLRTESRSGAQSPVNKEPVEQNPEGNFQESHQTKFDMPTASTDFCKSVGQTASPPSYMNSGPNETNFHVDTTSRSEDLESSDDLWLTVSEIPLVTQPTSAPPPSRPPPPRPARVSKSETGSFPANARRKEFSSFPNSTQYSHSPKSAHAAARSSMTSQIDELEDFAMGRARNNGSEHAEVLSAEDVETSSVAAASAAAMKQAMDRAEAKFRHAKEMREREHLKAARSKEAVQLDKDEIFMHDAQDRELREKQEILDRERQQRDREEEEREQKRLEKERERAREIEREREEKEREQRSLEKERERAREIERERGKARQAVERATREARERAAAEARLKAERAAVGKVNAEARERAERAAVHRAQAEARERAAADARERAEKAAAEARERANAETREKEAREKAAVARAEAEVRQRAERAAVERAAAEARERAAAAARAHQQKNDNDLESFFSMGSRPSSAPRPRANPSDPFFDTQSKGGPEVARRTSVGVSSSMKKASSTTNIVDDLSSIFGAAASSSGELQEVEGETEERRRARLERHQRTQERAVKALAEKNQRDLQAQRDQAERHRIGETLDVEIKRWAAGKEGNLRALLSTMQYVLWPECGWQPVSLTDLITGAAVKKAYRKATLCIHPDKVQQKGANLQQKYVAEKVFDLLKEAWNKFNSEELF